MSLGKTAYALIRRQGREEHRGMKCASCDGPLTHRRATVESPYRFAASGLRDLRLIGVKIWRCAKCATETAEIPKLDGLLDVVAEMLTMKPGLLTGEELRFLRKHVGFPAAKFAALMGVSAEHLSRFENEHERNQIGVPADRLARLIVASSRADTNVQDKLLELAAKLESPSKKSRRPAPALFRLDRNTWRQAA